MPEEQVPPGFQDLWLKYEAELAKLNLNEHPPPPARACDPFLSEIESLKSDLRRDLETSAAGVPLDAALSGRGDRPPCEDCGPRAAALSGRGDRPPCEDGVPLDAAKPRPCVPGGKQASAGRKRNIRKSIPASAAWPEEMLSARAAYGRALEEIRPLARMPDPQACRAAWTVADEMLSLLESGNQALLALIAASTAGDYRPGHFLNTAVLSLRLSLGLKEEWKRETRLFLGLCALLHDVPAGQASNLADPGGAPGPSEKEESLNHPLDMEGFPRRLREIEGAVKSRLEAVSRLERGGGEPVLHSGAGIALRDDDAALFSQIIVFCDVFETLSRPRPWREPMTMHAAMKLLIRGRHRELDARVVRAFIEAFSLFPPGSYIQLSSGQIARVIAVKAQAPSHPTVEVRLNPNGKPPSAALILDLAKSPFTHIVRAVDETKIPIEDKAVRAAFEAERWWTQP